MVKIYSSFAALLLSFGFAFCQTNDVKDQSKKNTNLVIQQPDASMLNQENNNKEFYALVAKKHLVLSEAFPAKNEAINMEATKKKELVVIKN